MTTLQLCETMESDHSVSQHIEGLREGDDSSAQQIWERYFQRLITLADRKLKSSPRKAMDEEDVVQQAFTEFFAQVQQGRFPKLEDRNDLWQILAMLVDRRAKDQIKRQNTGKAGGGRLRSESVFFVDGISHEKGGIAGVPDDLPTPEVAAEFVEMFEERLDLLKNREHRQIAVCKMQGFTNREIADRMKSSERTIERSLNHIRSVWRKSDLPGETE